MSIIREIKAAFRWVFNIKDEVKQEPMPEVKADDVFCHVAAPYIQVKVLKIDNNFITFRDYGSVPVRRLLHKDFRFHYRKIS